MYIVIERKFHILDSPLVLKILAVMKILLDIVSPPPQIPQVREKSPDMFLSGKKEGKSCARDLIIYKDSQAFLGGRGVDGGSKKSFYRRYFTF